jgi:localization factor PodJL
VESAAPRAASGPAGSDRAALRGLFDRLREHVAQAESRADTALGELSAALERPADPAALQAQAQSVMMTQRRAVQGVTRLADEVGAMAAGLEGRPAAGADPRAEALRAVDGELRAAAARLDARLVEADAHVERALAALSERLDGWEAAAAQEDRRLTIAVVDRLDAAEARRTDDVARLLAAVEQRLAEPARPAAARPQPQPEPQPEPRRRGSRSAALLLSAGVACLGLATLAVVLEPPLSPGEAVVEPGAEVVLRGPILIAPPRFAELDEFAPPTPEAGPAIGPDAQKALAAAIGDAEAGRPGAVGRLRALAEAGLPRAQMYLAKLYEAGKGVAADSAEARRWTARAADAGDPVAMHNLALYYLQGRGGPRDDELAARLLKRAAAAGVADSQFNLGLLYETGAGVERNLVEAYKWFQIAGNGGDLKARARAVSLEERLSARELANADRLVGGFRPGAAAPEETVLIAGAATVAEAQKKLARLGFYIGPTDGQDSPAYRQAVEAYRKSQSPTVASAGQP